MSSSNRSLIGQDTALVIGSLLIALVVTGIGSLFAGTDAAMVLGILAWMAAFGLSWPRIVRIGLERNES